MKLVVNPPTPCPNWQAPVSTRKTWPTIMERAVEGNGASCYKLAEEHRGTWRHNNATGPPDKGLSSLVLCCSAIATGRWPSSPEERRLGGYAMGQVALPKPAVKFWLSPNSRILYKRAFHGALSCELVEMPAAFVTSQPFRSAAQALRTEHHGARRHVACNCTTRPPSHVPETL